MYALKGLCLRSMTKVQNGNIIWLLKFQMFFLYA